MNVWQSYNQGRGYLVHFLRLLVVWWLGAQGSMATDARSGGVLTELWP